MTADLEAFRTELTGFCYRMLGSGLEAEDAVQETFVRAWRSFATFDQRRASLRTWLYRIATNHCLDLLRAARRRALPLGSARPLDSALGAPLSAEHWLGPVPDERVLPSHSSAEALTLHRETIRLAFVAALQLLPARQRATLILRDVLCWSAAEVADLLQTSTASVTSALQRARATVRAAAPQPGELLEPCDPVQRELLRRYCAAFERHDIPALVALLHHDATMTMPPFAWWVRGRDRIGAAMLDPQATCAGARLVPTAANGTPAYWQTRPDQHGVHRPFALILLDTRAGLITAITVFLGAEDLQPLFLSRRPALR